MGEELLWYASYGSNMLRERFLCYIKGGKFRGRGEDKGGCRDTSLPLEDRPLLIPRQLYFARNSSTWGGRGVAFLDKDRPGLTLGRMYKITREQFGEVKSQEGDWYRYELALGD
ncbi:MAG: gamma-glutamylcyclotransferase, partial [Planctomycetota bacterium]|nr:gamma-glutamylcyclotransferase [Planctomycetota bacterium]